MRFATTNWSVVLTAADLDSPQAAEAWAKEGGFATGNHNVPASIYPNAIDRSIGTAVSSAKGVVFDMALLSADGTFKALLEQKGIARIKAEVRWGKSAEEGFTHGLKLVNLSEIQLDFLFGLLREVFTRNRDAAIA